MRRRYRILDGAFEPSDRVVWLDLDSPRVSALTILADELGASAGRSARIRFGRDVADIQKAAVDAGVFPTGEHPRVA